MLPDMSAGGGGTQRHCMQEDMFVSPEEGVCGVESPWVQFHHLP